MKHSALICIFTLGCSFQPPDVTGENPTGSSDGSTPEFVGQTCLSLLRADSSLATGVYRLDPDGDGDASNAWEAFCDMETDGGGWILAAKLHRYHDGPGYDEPRGWWSQLADEGSLRDGTSYANRVPGQASHGMGRLQPVGAQLARFVLIAEDDEAQRAVWFKAVDAGIWDWFSHRAHEATLVCTDVAMSENCTMGRIQGSPTNITGFGGMNLNDHGYTTQGRIHMRLDGDPGSGTQRSGVCSDTINFDNNAWRDSAVDGHWGNGLEIWLR